jgi:hypothetical protein
MFVLIQKQWPLLSLEDLSTGSASSQVAEGVSGLSKEVAYLREQKSLRELELAESKLLNEIHSRKEAIELARTMIQSSAR